MRREPDHRWRAPVREPRRDLAAGHARLAGDLLLHAEPDRELCVHVLYFLEGGAGHQVQLRQGDLPVRRRGRIVTIGLLRANHPRVIRRDRRSRVGM